MANINYVLTDNISEEEQGISIEGYTNKWSAFEALETDEEVFLIYENDRYGDLTCYVVIGYINGQPVDIFETYDNIVQCLIDEEVLTDD